MGDEVRAFGQPFGVAFESVAQRMMRAEGSTAGRSVLAMRSQTSSIGPTVRSKRRSWRRRRKMRRIVACSGKALIAPSSIACTAISSFSMIG